MSAILTKSWKIVHNIEIENMIRQEQGFQPYENINYMKKRWIEETYAGMNTSIKSPGYFECDELIALYLQFLMLKDMKLYGLVLDTMKIDIQRFIFLFNLGYIFQIIHII